jgi:hypothetical protein
MRRRRLSMPELALIAGTRVALGVGVGLLMGERINDRARKGAAWALLGMGVLTTFPILGGLFRKRPLSERLLA